MRWVGHDVRCLKAVKTLNPIIHRPADLQLNVDLFSECSACVIFLDLSKNVP